MLVKKNENCNEIKNEIKKKNTCGLRHVASRATAAAAVPVLPFQLIEAAWGLVEVMLVCGRRGCASQAVAAAAPIAILTCT